MSARAVQAFGAGLFAMILSPVLLLAAEQPVLRWGADCDGGAPYVFRDPENPERLIGFEVDLVEALSKKLGRKSEFVQNQWDGLVPGLKRGDYDIAINGIEITEERLREASFSIPYFHTYEQISVRQGDEAIHSLAAARGKIAGALTGSLAERILEEAGGIESRSYSSQTNLYEDLANGRLDLVLMDQPVAVYYADPDPRLRSVGEPIGRMSYGIALKKENRELLASIDRALEDLKKEGVLRDIYDRWGIWNPLVAREFKDGSPSRPARELERYLSSRDGFSGWKAKLSRYSSYLPLLLEGALTTVKLSVLGMALAVVLGLLLALARLYGGPVLSALSLAYVEVFRGTPLLIQLFLLFYGLPYLGVKLTPLVAAVLGLGLNYAASEAEVYRAGILSVPQGQADAAFSLGLNRRRTLRHVILPQAMRVVLPPMTNDFIALLKDSSLVSIITMVELTKVYGQLASATYDHLGLGILTAILYFLMGLPFVRLARRAERRASLGWR